eukprot:gene1371-1574_t
MRRIRDIVNVFNHLQQRVSELKTKKQALFLDTREEAYWSMKADVVQAEFIILREFGYMMTVELPHKFILNYMKLLDKSNELAQKAWNYLNDSMRTTVSVQYRPEAISAASIYMAARMLRVKLPEDPYPWWEIFDTTKQDINLEGYGRYEDSHRRGWDELCQSEQFRKVIRGSLTKITTFTCDTLGRMMVEDIASVTSIDTRHSVYLNEQLVLPQCPRLTHLRVHVPYRGDVGHCFNNFMERQEYIVPTLTSLTLDTVYLTGYLWNQVGAKSFFQDICPLMPQLSELNIVSNFTASHPLYGLEVDNISTAEDNLSALLAYLKQSRITSLGYRVLYNHVTPKLVELLDYLLRSDQCNIDELSLYTILDIKGMGLLAPITRHIDTLAIFNQTKGDFKDEVSHLDRPLSPIIDEKELMSFNNITHLSVHLNPNQESDVFLAYLSSVISVNTSIKTLLLFPTTWTHCEETNQDVLDFKSNLMGVAYSRTVILMYGESYASLQFRRIIGGSLTRINTYSLEVLDSLMVEDIATVTSIDTQHQVFLGQELVVPQCLQLTHLRVHVPYGGDVGQLFNQFMERQEYMVPTLTSLTLDSSYLTDYLWDQVGAREFYQGIPLKMPLLTELNLISNHLYPSNQPIRAHQIDGRSIADDNLSDLLAFLRQSRITTFFYQVPYYHVIPHYVHLLDYLLRSAECSITKISLYIVNSDHKTLLTPITRHIDSLALCCPSKGRRKATPASLNLQKAPIFSPIDDMELFSYFGQEPAWKEICKSAQFRKLIKGSITKIKTFSFDTLDVMMAEDIATLTSIDTHKTVYTGYGYPPLGLHRFPKLTHLRLHVEYCGVIDGFFARFIADQTYVSPTLTSLTLDSYYLALYLWNEEDAKSFYQDTLPQMPLLTELNLFSQNTLSQLSHASEMMIPSVCDDNTAALLAYLKQSRITRFVYPIPYDQMTPNCIELLDYLLRSDQCRIDKLSLWLPISTDRTVLIPITRHIHTLAIYPLTTNQSKDIDTLTAIDTPYLSSNDFRLQLNTSNKITHLTLRLRHSSIRSGMFIHYQRFMLPTLTSLTLDSDLLAEYLLPNDISSLFFKALPLHAPLLSELKLVSHTKLTWSFIFRSQSLPIKLYANIKEYLGQSHITSFAFDMPYDHQCPDVERLLDFLLRSDQYSLSLYCLPGDDTYSENNNYLTPPPKQTRYGVQGLETFNNINHLSFYLDPCKHDTKYYIEFLTQVIRINTSIKSLTIGPIRNGDPRWYDKPQYTESFNQLKDAINSNHNLTIFVKTLTGKTITLEIFVKTLTGKTITLEIKADYNAFKYLHISDIGRLTSLDIGIRNLIELDSGLKLTHLGIRINHYNRYDDETKSIITDLVDRNQLSTLQSFALKYSDFGATGTKQFFPNLHQNMPLLVHLKLYFNYSIDINDRFQDIVDYLKQSNVTSLTFLVPYPNDSTGILVLIIDDQIVDYVQHNWNDLCNSPEFIRIYSNSLTKIKTDSYDAFQYLAITDISALTSLDIGIHSPVDLPAGLKLTHLRICINEEDSILNDFMNKSKQILSTLTSFTLDHPDLEGPESRQFIANLYKHMPLLTHLKIHITHVIDTDTIDVFHDMVAYLKQSKITSLSVQLPYQSDSRGIPVLYDYLLRNQECKIQKLSILTPLDCERESPVTPITRPIDYLDICPNISRYNSYVHLQYASSLIRCNTKTKTLIIAPQNHELYEEKDRYQLDQEFQVFIDAINSNRTLEAIIFTSRFKRQYHALYLSLLHIFQSVNHPATYN